MKYKMSWTRKDGVVIDNQIFTADFITTKLRELEECGATNIKIESIN